MLLKRRILICWTQTPIPESSWADYSFFKLEDELFVEGGVMSCAAGIAAVTKVRAQAQPHHP
jgi:hypothetical protein